jgi:hypothetical protein
MRTTRMPTINPLVYTELVRVARAGGTITYGDLGERADLVPGRGPTPRSSA